MTLPIGSQVFDRTRHAIEGELVSIGRRIAIVLKADGRRYSVLPGNLAPVRRPRKVYAAEVLDFAARSGLEPEEVARHWRTA